MNPTLRRQVRKAYGDEKNVPGNVAELLALVERTYDGFEQDRKLTEHSLEVSSQELEEKNARLTEEVRRLQQSRTQYAQLEQKYQDLATLKSEIEKGEKHGAALSTQLTRLATQFTEKDYGALLNALNQTALVSVTDSKGDILYVNEKFIATSQYSLRELLGQNHRILKSGHQPQEIFVELWKTISGGQVWRGEIKNRAKDGSYYWVDTSIAPIVGANGKPERYISVRLLITNRKELEGQVSQQVADLEKTKVAMLNVLEDLDSEKKKLEGSQKAMISVLEDLNVEKKKLEFEKTKDEAILKGIADGVVAVDAQGVVLFVNTAAATLLGTSPEKMQGHQVVQVMTMLDASGARVPDDRRPVQQVLTERKSFVDASSYAYQRTDGTSFPVALTIAPIVLGEELVGTIEVFRDITREREIDRAKSEFVSLASHQLRTPLSTINWYAEMLTAGDAGALTAEQKKYVEEIYRGNQRMVELVNALLNVSRLELGTFSVDPKPTDILKIVRDVVIELEPKIFERKIDLEENYAADIPLMNVDPNLMRIIFQNLISNAVKYTAPEGKVVVRVAVKGDTEATRQLCVEVEDTGFGIPKAAQPKIFTKLYRADNVRIRETDGTGLGLYIVKSILENTSGSISFVSEENKGTTFTACLPLAGMQKKEGAKALGT